MVRPRTALLTGLLLFAASTAACGADPEPSPRAHGLVHSESGGAWAASGSANGGATGGTPHGLAGAPAVAASTGGAPEPASIPASGGSPAHAGASGATHASGGSAAGAPSSSSDFEQRCHENAADACAHCVCGKCATEAEACERRPGCSEIAACVLQTGCQGAACFCGTADAIRCLSGAANGPCKDVILGAPGGRSPTIADQSAGPAADAAVALGACTEPPSGVCSAECW